MYIRLVMNGDTPTVKVGMQIMVYKLLYNLKQHNTL